MQPERLVDPPESLPPGLRRRLWLLGTDLGLSRLRLGLIALLVVSVLAFVAVGANRPGDPSLEPVTGRTPPPGFSETNFSLTGSGGESGSGCAVLAQAEAQWQEGFMNKRAIPGYEAMVFAFDSDRDGPFFNRNVPITLDIAWFDSSGKFVDAERMPPCEDIEGCPLYRPAAPYRFAVETPVGGLARLGIETDSVLAVGGQCPG